MAEARYVITNSEWRQAEIVGAYGKWRLDPGNGVGVSGGSEIPVELICEVSDGCTDSLRAVVRMGVRESPRYEYRMYRTSKGETPGSWSIRRSDMAESWRLNTTTGELMGGETGSPLRVTRDMPYAYGAVLQSCDHGDWHHALRYLCLMHSRLEEPGLLFDLDETDGMWLITVLEMLLRSQHEHGETMIALAQAQSERDKRDATLRQIGDELTTLISRDEQGQTGRKSAMAALLGQSTGSTLRDIQGVVMTHERMADVVKSATAWIPPANCITVLPPQKGTR